MPADDAAAAACVEDSCAVTGDSYDQTTRSQTRHHHHHHQQQQQHQQQQRPNDNHDAPTPTCSSHTSSSPSSPSFFTRSHTARDTFQTTITTSSSSSSSSIAATSLVVAVLAIIVATSSLRDTVIDTVLGGKGRRRRGTMGQSGSIYVTVNEAMSLPDPPLLESESTESLSSSSSLLPWTKVEIESMSSDSIDARLRFLGVDPASAYASSMGGQGEKNDDNDVNTLNSQSASTSTRPSSSSSASLQQRRSCLAKVSHADFWRINHQSHPMHKRVKAWMFVHTKYREQIHDLALMSEQAAIDAEAVALEATAKAGIAPSTSSSSSSSLKLYPPTDLPQIKLEFGKFVKKIERHSKFEEEQLFRFFREMVVIVVTETKVDADAGADANAKKAHDVNDDGRRRLADALNELTRQHHGHGNNTKHKKKKQKMKKSIKNNKNDANANVDVNDNDEDEDDDDDDDDDDEHNVVNIKKLKKSSSTKTTTTKTTLSDGVYNALKDAMTASVVDANGYIKDTKNRSAAMRNVANAIESYRTNLLAHLELEERTLIGPWLGLSMDLYQTFRKEYLRFPYSFMY